MAEFDDSYNNALLVWSAAYLAAFDGRIEAAKTMLADFRAHNEIPYISRALWMSMAEADVALFEGRLDEALERSTALLDHARTHRLDRVRLLFSYYGQQQARVLAQLLFDGREPPAAEPPSRPPAAELVTRLRRWIRLFARGPEPMLQAIAATHRAGLHELEGDREAARRCWATALRSYGEGDMLAHAAAVRLRLATYEADPSRLIAESQAYFERERVAGWRRFVELFAPSPHALAD